MGTPAVFAAPDGLAMRRTMGRFLTGVAVVTTEHEGEQYGMTINSLTTISLDPPILMISLSFNTRTGDALLASAKFAISILGAKQEVVARQFATRGGARFEAGKFDTTEGGLSVITGALSPAECKVVHQYDIGDHQVFFGQVVACRDRDGGAWRSTQASLARSATSTTTPCPGPSRKGPIAVTSALSPLPPPGHQ